MKIFYAIQATGNGHIARALELMPYLRRYGQVDIFLSGSNSHLKCDLPVKYRSKGLSLCYGNRGGLDYYQMWKALNVKRIWNEAKDLPVEKYDVVINDFESITSLACKLKRVPSLGFGHQASFQSPRTPRPRKRDLLGEFILKHYASAAGYIGLHFAQYDDLILNPVIKADIINADPGNKEHITVYLSHYADEVVAKHLKKIGGIRFEVFSKKVKCASVDDNITFTPISGKAFNESMINCAGIITGAGFETPAEALYLGKKLLCLPIRGQYEQLCNAAALKEYNIAVIDSMGEAFPAQVTQWLEKGSPKPLELTNTTNAIVAKAMEAAEKLHNGRSLPGEILSLPVPLA